MGEKVPQASGGGVAAASTGDDVADFAAFPSPLALQPAGSSPCVADFCPTREVAGGDLLHPDPAHDLELPHRSHDSTRGMGVPGAGGSKE